MVLAFAWRCSAFTALSVTSLSNKMLPSHTDLHPSPALEGFLGQIRHVALKNRGLSAFIPCRDNTETSVKTRDKLTDVLACLVRTYTVLSFTTRNRPTVYAPIETHDGYFDISSS